MTEFRYQDYERLKLELSRISQFHTSAMLYYCSNDGKGFRHYRDQDRASCSSTATCLSSLAIAGLKPKLILDNLPMITKTLIERENWKSAGLKAKNPFTVAFICEGILDAKELKVTDDDINVYIDKIKKEAVPILIEELERNEPPKFERGSVSMEPYPASGYLTQLVFRVLSRLDSLEEQHKNSVREWATREISRQISLHSSASKNADPLQLAYAVMLSASAQPAAHSTPEDKELRSQGLRLFFDCQRPDGSWPLGNPLFHYPSHGNAYCFEYELLAQLLACKELWPDLFSYMGNLEMAAKMAISKRYEIPADAKESYEATWAWSSGHHPQLSGPESWSTASVYHFVHNLDRLVAEGIRRTVFAELGESYARPHSKNATASNGASPRFADELLDSPLYDSKSGERKSLKEVLQEKYVDPLYNDRHRIEKGLKGGVAISAILYGPPGTSKTTYAEKISEYLDWPLLALDPSHLVNEGIDNIYASANRIFRMLSHLESVVVLLDEFDELGRERQRSGEMLSRLITTTMLPKLIKINKSKKIAFLLATNFVENFDSAFSRRGRFDIMLQVLPPSYEAKCAKWPIFKTAIEQFDANNAELLKEKIEDLTYDEASELANQLDSICVDKSGTNYIKIQEGIESTFNGSTMNKSYEDTNKETINYNQDVEILVEATPGPNTWKDVCKLERKHYRVPS